MKRRTTYIIPNPSSDYARGFIRTIFTGFGIRPILAYTSPYERFCLEREHPILTSTLIEATFDVSDWTIFANSIKGRYDVLAVIPHFEPAVEVAAILCELLNIDWNTPDLIRMFRNKILLKQHLSSAGVRVPTLRAIGSSEDLEKAEIPERFVLKPVDGYGNRMIGVFTRTEMGAARRHLDSGLGVNWMLEEFVSGPEFSINGQVRSGGEVEIHGINEYRRCSVGNYHTVYDYEFQCPSVHPCFGVLLDFASLTISATGLRRSPFHMEVIIDSQGPCVIDLGARIGGSGLANMLSRSHPELPDVISIAAHDYIQSSNFAMGKLSWHLYDRLLSMQIFGLAHKPAVIHSLHGLKQVEAIPEFINWITKPELGDKIFPTDHLYSAPFCLDVWAPNSEDDRVELVARIRDTIRWNEKALPLAPHIALLRRKLTRLPRRLSWLSHSCLAKAGGT